MSVFDRMDSQNSDFCNLWHKSQNQERQTAERQTPQKTILRKTDTPENKKTGKNVLKKYLQFLFYFKLGQAMSEYEIPMVARGPRTEAS